VQIEHKVAELYEILKNKGFWNEKITKEFLVKFVKCKLRLRTLRSSDKDVFDSFFAKVREIQNN
jgi:hypothetical protein